MWHVFSYPEAFLQVLDFKMISQKYSNMGFFPELGTAPCEKYHQGGFQSLLRKSGDGFAIPISFSISIPISPHFTNKTQRTQLDRGGYITLSMVQFLVFNPRRPNPPPPKASGTTPCFEERCACPFLTHWTHRHQRSNVVPITAPFHSDGNAKWISCSKPRIWKTAKYGFGNLITYIMSQR